MNRTFIVAANWKMNKTPAESAQFIKEFLPLLKTNGNKKVLIFPPATNLLKVIETLESTSSLNKIEVGGQNIHFENSGAFTGENSPVVLKSLKSEHVLVGHSERRTLFHETDDICSKKVQSAQKNGLTPMLCLGETLNERNSGQTENVIERQLIQGLRLADKNLPLTIAYEPVWAIGTGQVATPEQAQQAHRFLRQVLEKTWGKQNISILYGGSVKSSNAAELAKLPDIDGFLVGGASLDPVEFSKIANVEVLK